MRKDTVSADEDIAIDSMVNLKCNTYLPKLNLIVRSFLKGVDNISNDAVTESHLDKPDAYKLSKTAESIMNLSVTNSVFPLHFRESLIEFSLTHRKLAFKITKITIYVDNDCFIAYKDF